MTRPGERGRPRCGHCGQFVPEPLDAFGEHLDGPCPVGGTFNTNGVLRGRKRTPVGSQR